MSHGYARDYGFGTNGLWKLARVSFPPRCAQMPITAPYGNAMKFPQYDESSRANVSRLGGVSVTWENEADALIASRPKFANSDVKGTQHQKSATIRVQPAG